MDVQIRRDVEGIIDANRKALSQLDGRGILITGGAGFLGAYFLDLLSLWNETGAKKHCQIYCLDTFITGTPRRIAHLEGKGYFHKIAQSVTEPLPPGLEVDYIMHFASIASPTFYRKYPLETIDSNVAGTRNLLEYAAKRKIASIVFLSTSEIYGDPVASMIPTPEDYRGNVSCTGPRACYDESKRLGETLCMTFFRQKNVPVKIIRPFNVYGPGLRIDDKRIIPDLFHSAIFEGGIALHSDGKPTRSFCYVSDAVDAMLKVLLSKLDGEQFNVGDDSQEISMLELAKMVRSQFSDEMKLTFKASEEKDYLTDNPLRRCPDLKKIRSLLGYEPKVGLAEGLSRLKGWYERELEETGGSGR
jgi:dTDP-glucose 4,6-dehydratase/UDP-glucuronate decarboxylase